MEIKKIQKLSHEMKELLEDERLKEIRSKDDKDARFGHKTATSTFYGYKNHLAMTEERLIAGDHCNRWRSTRWAGITKN